MLASSGEITGRTSLAGLCAQHTQYTFVCTFIRNVSWRLVYYRIIVKTLTDNIGRLFSSEETWMKSTNYISFPIVSSSPFLLFSRSLFPRSHYSPTFRERFHGQFGRTYKMKRQQEKQTAGRGLKAGNCL